MNTPVRIERDAFGPIDVPAAALWGAQTQRSLHFFAISGERMPVVLIRALAEVKRACAVINGELGLLAGDKAAAIITAADEVLAGGHADAFPLSVWQTGSGTQTNMNMNEVLANRASELLGGSRGSGRRVHPNDHVNLSQSTNDVYPTAVRLTALRACPALIEEQRLASSMVRPSRGERPASRQTFRAVSRNPSRWSAASPAPAAKPQASTLR